MLAGNAQLRSWGVEVFGLLALARQCNVTFDSILPNFRDHQFNRAGISRNVKFKGLVEDTILYFNPLVVYQEAQGVALFLAIRPLVQHLSEEVASMREGLAELYERVDFTERMLAETRSKNVIGPGDST